MNASPHAHGIDLPLSALTPLKEREAFNPKTHKGYIRIRSSIQAVGLIQPLAVYREGNGYVILNGYLRFRACQELQVETVPCIVCPDKDAYTFNRMVNGLSDYQEMRMLRKSLETLDRQTIASVFGMRSIRHRLAPGLIEQLHPKVAEAFEADLLGRTAAVEMSCVKPERQVEMLADMRRIGDYTPSFVRALILKTAPELRNAKRTQRRPWSENKARRQDLMGRLEEAEEQHEFYTRLYRQYSADLLKMALYVRKIITTPALSTYMKEHFEATLRELSEIVMETQVSPAIPAGGVVNATSPSKGVRL